MSPRRPPYRSPWRHRAYVLAVAAARALLARAGRSDEPLIRRLVAANNRRVERRLAAHGAATVLLILPRCVRRGCCKIDDGGSLATCLGCDRCDLGELARVANRFQVEALVAFRSHVAFALARERRPDLIIATACDDRLIKALRSVPEIPALLAPLTGMERMCVNATFDPAWFAAQLRLATAPREAEHDARAADRA
ncbi:MAG: DUF116 domain-containing protein [bacterium]|nr:DUF116 domain-containing protein [bacterium]